MDAREGGEDARNVLLNELDELDRVTHGIAVPLSYTDELYALRNNIYAVRRRLLATWTSEGDGAALTPALSRVRERE